MLRRLPNPLVNSREDSSASRIAGSETKTVHGVTVLGSPSSPSWTPNAARPSLLAQCLPVFAIR